MIYLLQIITIILVFFVFKKLSKVRRDYIDIHNRIVDIEHNLEKVFPDNKDDYF